MKSVNVVLLQNFLESPPSRGAWIEIRCLQLLLAEKAASPPSRGAWIEITHGAVCFQAKQVAPLAGGVD